jgi:hypothetical protein
MSDSTPKKHGGARPGAGRPRSKTKRLVSLCHFEFQAMKPCGCKRLPQRMVTRLMHGVRQLLDER